jgi:hypothetical protein
MEPVYSYRPAAGLILLTRKESKRYEDFPLPPTITVDLGLVVHAVCLFHVLCILEKAIILARRASCRMGQKIRVRLLLMFLGATSFWGPPTLATFLTRRELGYIMGTLTSAPLFLLSFFVLRRMGTPAWRSNSVWMLWGTFLLGGVFSSIAFTALEAGYSGLSLPEALKMFSISLIPGWIALYGVVSLYLWPGLLIVIITTAWILDRPKRDASTRGNLED